MQSARRVKAVVITSIIVMLFMGLSAAESPRVELAILLDTSGSMDGLIEQAKTQLWKIVNELALSRRNGEAIKLFVGLYEYGKDSLPDEEGYMRMICPLTGDLDLISEELFALQTNGGSEYCGQVISRATGELDWSSDNRDLKMIFIAGNEPFTQGNVDYRTACKSAIGKGIIVNTIFCGDYQEGISTNWKDGAELADGKYLNIDQNETITYIEAPQDEEILALNNKLNETYIAFGSGGEGKKMRQEEQDSNALTLSGAIATERAVAKSSGQYRNVDWDLVDASKEGLVEIDKLEDESLPQVMKDMTVTERESYIDSMAVERQLIQEKINTLNEERKKFVAQEMLNQPDNTLDSAILKAVREIAIEKKYSFDD